MLSSWVSFLLLSTHTQHSSLITLLLRADWRLPDRPGERGRTYLHQVSIRLLLIDAKQNQTNSRFAEKSCPESVVASNFSKLIGQTGQIGPMGVLLFNPGGTDRAAQHSALTSTSPLNSFVV